MAQEHKGSWDVPGGGRELGETIKEVAIREVMEEATVKIKDIEVVGFQKLIIKGERPGKYKRPYPEAYEVFVRAIVSEELPFKVTDEMIDRKYFDIEEAVKEDGIQFENRHVIFDKILKAV